MSADECRWIDEEVVKQRSRQKDKGQRQCNGSAFRSPLQDIAMTRTLSLEITDTVGHNILPQDARQPVRVGLLLEEEEEGTSVARVEAVVGARGFCW